MGYPQDKDIEPFVRNLHFEIKSAHRAVPLNSYIRRLWIVGCTSTMPWSKVLVHQPARFVACYRDIPVLHAMMTLLGTERHPMVVELGVAPGITLMLERGGLAPSFFSL
jgi:hypothetical protein